MYRTAASLLQAKTHITTLSNGLRIATEASSKDLSSIVLRVACGSLHETPMTSGASSIASRMIAGCSPASRKLHEITTGMSASSKESTYYCVLGEKPNVFQMVELLIESMRNQMFLESDVHEQIEIVKAENRTPSFSRLLHQAAYWGALANPDYPLAFPGCLNSEVLKNFVTEHYTAPRMILWVHGAEHDDILSVAKPLLLDLPGGPIPPEPKSVYTGSDSRYNVDFKSHQPITQVTLAFEVPVAWHKMKGYRSDVTLDILKELLGGNAEWDPLMKGSKSPNYSRSRLCVRILNKYPQVHEVSALSGIRNDTGLFAIQVNTDIDFASQAIDLITKEFLEMATPGKVSQAELDCVKQSMGSLVQNSLEANMVRSMRIVDEIWRFGERITVEQKLKAMDEVTLTDIESLAGKLFSSPLTMLSVGKVANVPSYDSEHYTAPRMILWVNGAEHDDILYIISLLLDLPGGPIPPEPKSVYTGGDSRYNVHFESQQPITQVVLAFEVPVVWLKMKGYWSDVTLNILKELLGGVADFVPLMNSSNLPSYSRSRLCVRILNKYPQVHDVSAVSVIHHDTGLFGIQVKTEIDFASKAIDLVAKEFLEIATPGKVSQAELDFAKQSMESSVLKSLEENMMTRSMKIVDELSRFGERITVEQTLKAMDEVTLMDIESLAGKLLSSPLTMLSIGNVENVPSYDSVSRKFHAK